MPRLADTDRTTTHKTTTKPKSRKNTHPKKLKFKPGQTTTHIDLQIRKTTVNALKKCAWNWGVSVDEVAEDPLRFFLGISRSHPDDRYRWKSLPGPKELLSIRVHLTTYSELIYASKRWSISLDRFADQILGSYMAVTREEERHTAAQARYIEWLADRHR